MKFETYKTTGNWGDVWKPNPVKKMSRLETLKHCYPNIYDQLEAMIKEEKKKSYQKGVKYGRSHPH